MAVSVWWSPDAAAAAVTNGAHANDNANANENRTPPRDFISLASPSSSIESPRTLCVRVCAGGGLWGWRTKGVCHADRHIALLPATFFCGLPACRSFTSCHKYGCFSSSPPVVDLDMEDMMILDFLQFNSFHSFLEIPPPLLCGKVKQKSRTQTLLLLSLLYVHVYCGKRAPPPPRCRRMLRSLAFFFTCVHIHFQRG